MNRARPNHLKDKFYLLEIQRNPLMPVQNQDLKFPPGKMLDIIPRDLSYPGARLNML